MHLWVSAKEQKLIEDLLYMSVSYLLNILKGFFEYRKLLLCTMIEP